MRQFSRIIPSIIYAKGPVNWRYLYRAIDRAGNLVDSILSEKQDALSTSIGRVTMRNFSSSSNTLHMMFPYY
ncbi:MAG TPA: hypothetical protein VEU97_16605 [Ktedonobacteraceae bacterium]|nr:hypothetical protein [Ktedonobacteraceae bacterium]